MIYFIISQLRLPYANSGSTFYLLQSKLSFTFAFRRIKTLNIGKDCTTTFFWNVVLLFFKFLLELCTYILCTWSISSLSIKNVFVTGWIVNKTDKINQFNSLVAITARKMMIINNTQLLKIVLFIEDCWSNIRVHMWEWYAETLVKVSESVDSKGCSGY